MTKKLFVMLALSLALSACESETPESNSNGNTAKPTATQMPTPVSAPSQEASPAAVKTELKAGDKVKVTVNGASAHATVVSVDEKDQSSVITLPANENAVVRFQLSIKGGAHGVYPADLFTASGETVFSAEPLKAFRAKSSSIDFDVPASTLKSGPYQIKLSRVDDPAKQESAQYYFRVQ